MKDPKDMKVGDSLTVAGDTWILAERRRGAAVWRRAKRPWWRRLWMWVTR